ncbi:alpha/beta hydrolase [Legionella oakridgensis]|uniref:alpha/beta hydrolase n=1 Tax=Legionella oakridgensis TaxID=29423 RepID=UPI0003DE0293|nr:membrane protein [Legionella oakridgensis]ETO94158.1 putative hydrolase of the alpha/beta superfamily [Legionella oakridgensis RV-2-2007]
MLPTHYLNTAGEHPFVIEGQAGQLEGIFTVPEKARTDYLAVLGHPHSLQGGSMNNKVVTTLARLFKELAVPSIRFNFRGVGQSAGLYDHGIGESEDMLSIARQYKEQISPVNFIFAGFSFGSYVAYRTAAQHEHALLITVAPPVHHYDYTEYDSVPAPWILVQGDDDDVVPLQFVLDFAARLKPSISVLRFPETGHFFHGRLLELKSGLLELVRRQVPTL